MNRYVHIQVSMCAYTHIDVSLCTYIYIYVDESLITLHNRPGGQTYKKLAQGSYQCPAHKGQAHKGPGGPNKGAAHKGPGKPIRAGR